MKLIIAGGGTGGHIFAGISVAEELLKNEKNSKVLFIGSNYGMEKKIFSEYPYNYELLNIRGIKGKGVLGLIKGVMLIPLSVVKSIKLILKFKPDAVLGVGGYSSGPVLIAAWILRKKTGILEQNSIPGITNIILSKFVNKIFTVFEYAEKSFQKGKIQRTGNPCRNNIAKISESVANENKVKQNEAKFNVLVIGGSQGAKKLNDFVCEATKILSKKYTNLFVTHQVGARDFDRIKNLYGSDKGENYILKDFISDMAGAYKEADMVISRSGVGTLVEIAAAKKPCLLIPFPFASDNHQEFNAKELVSFGGARWKKESELTGENLASEISAFVENKNLRDELSNNVSKFYKQDSAQKIIEGLK